MGAAEEAGARDVGGEEEVEPAGRLEELGAKLEGVVDEGAGGAVVVGVVDDCAGGVVTGVEDEDGAGVEELLGGGGGDVELLEGGTVESRAGRVADAISIS